MGGATCFQVHRDLAQRRVPVPGPFVVGGWRRGHRPPPPIACVRAGGACAFACRRQRPRRRVGRDALRRPSRWPWREYENPPEPMWSHYRCRSRSPARVSRREAAARRVRRRLRRRFSPSWASTSSRRLPLFGGIQPPQVSSVASWRRCVQGLPDPRRCLSSSRRRGRQPSRSLWTVAAGPPILC